MAPYSRYWHGYLVVLKPLLCFLDLNGIRRVNGGMQLFLMLLTAILLWRKGLKPYIPAYFLCMAMLVPKALASCMQYSTCFYIMTLGVLAVSLNADTKKERMPIVFLLIGIATSYIDYLTYPIATLGVPAVLYCCVRETSTVGKTFREGLMLCFSWGLGYIGMWACKWILGELAGVDVMESAMSSLAFRTSSSAPDMLLDNIRTAFLRNIEYYLRSPAHYLALALCAVLIILALFRLIKNKVALRRVARICLPFGILACMPLAWYVVASNHSAIHYRFTNKALVVSSFAILCGLIKLCGQLRTQAEPMPCEESNSNTHF